MYILVNTDTRLMATSMASLALPNFSYFSFAAVEWWTFGEHSYHFALEKMDWQDADKYCRSVAARILALETENEFHRTIAFINSTYGR